MLNHQYEILNNTIQVQGEDNLEVYDFGEWECGRVRRIKILLAHEKDMEYAREYLNQMFLSPNTTLIDGALLNSAFQLLVKCFSNPSGKGRPNLNVEKVFRIFTKSIGVRDLTKAFTEISDARNKVIAHDQIAFEENIVGLVVDKATCDAEDIATITIRTGYLYPQNRDLLLEMVDVVLQYISSQIDELKGFLISSFNDNPNKPSLQKICVPNTPMATSW